MFNSLCIFQKMYSLSQCLLMFSLSIFNFFVLFLLLCLLQIVLYARFTLPICVSNPFFLIISCFLLLCQSFYFYPNSSPIVFNFFFCHFFICFRPMFLSIYQFFYKCLPFSRFYFSKISC